MTDEMQTLTVKNCRKKQQAKVPREQLPIKERENPGGTSGESHKQKQR